MPLQIIFRNPRMPRRELKTDRVSHHLFIKVKLCCMRGSYTIKGIEIGSLPLQITPKSIQISPLIWGVTQLPGMYCQYYPLSTIHPLLQLLEVAQCINLIIHQARQMLPFLKALKFFHRKMLIEHRYPG